MKFRYEGLTEVSMPPLESTVVTAPELKLSGGLKATSRRVAVRLLVTDPTTGQTREFDPTVNNERTGWSAEVTLFPGANHLGYVVRYDDNRKELRQVRMREVRYVRPPVVLGGSLSIGTADSGTMNLAVASAPESAPELEVNGKSVGVSTTRKPLRVFGASLWMLTAPGVSANPDRERLDPVKVVVSNGEGTSGKVDVKVEGEERVVIVEPTLVLTYSGGTIPATARSRRSAIRTSPSTCT